MSMEEHKRRMDDHRRRMDDHRRRFEALAREMSRQGSSIPSILGRSLTSFTDVRSSQSTFVPAGPSATSRRDFPEQKAHIADGASVAHPSRGADGPGRSSTIALGKRTAFQAHVASVNDDHFTQDVDSLPATEEYPVLDLAPQTQVAEQGDHADGHRRTPGSAVSVPDPATQTQVDNGDNDWDAISNAGVMTLLGLASP